MENEKTHNDEHLDTSLKRFYQTFPDYKPALATPSMYYVVLLNDDFTPHEYVLSILRDCFHLAHDEAVHMMLLMQQHGEVICGTYTREVAETKMIHVTTKSKDLHQPLRCTIRKEIE